MAGRRLRGYAAALLCWLGCAAAAQAQTPPPAATLQLREVRFSGHTRLSDAELQAIAAPFVGTPLRALDVEELRQRVTRAYVERGHVNSGALLVDDSAPGGVLELRIVEGVVDTVRQTGQGRLSETYLASRLAPPGEVLHLPTLQERFQLLLADPLFTRLQGRLLPGDAPGRALLDVAVTRARPWQLALFAHNHIAPAVGSDTVGVEGTLRNLSGWGDRLGLSLQRSGGSTGGELGWQLPLEPIAAGRTSLGLRLANQRSSVVEEPLAALDIDSRVAARDATLAHLWVDDARQRWSSGLTHTLRRNRTRLAGEPYSFVPAEPTGTLRTESWRLHTEGTLRLGRPVLALRLGLVQGRSNVGTDAEITRVPAARYRLWQAQGQLAWPLGDDGVQLQLRAQAQRSRQVLVPLEQMAVGGRHTVRGWRENTRVRDNAQVASVELHWPLWRSADAATLTLVPFADAGSAWNRGERHETLSSAGLGLLLAWQGLEAELFAARRLHGPHTDTRGNWQDHGIHLLLRWRPPA